MRVVFLAPLLAVACMLGPANPLAGEPSRGSDSDELKQEPRQTRHLLETALRFEKQGQTAAAIAAYGDLLRQVPAHQKALRHRAQLLLQSGHVEGASHDLSALLVAHPDDGAAWSSYGDCMQALHREKDAAGAYRKAVENGLNNASVNRKRGDALAAAGDNEAALEAYSSAVKLRLDNPESYFVRAMLLMKMKRERDAIDDFTRAIEFNPDYAEAYFNRGRAWGELRQFPDAVRDLSAFLRMKPEDGPALGYRGAALDTLGRVDEALADYAGALKADPANSRVLMARAQLYSRLDRHADALADLDRAIVLDPLNAYFYLARGGAQLALGATEKALADRTRAIELAPANATMWYSRATIYFSLGQSDKALNDAVEALRLNTGFEAARKLIDEIQASRNQAPERLKLATALQTPAAQSAKLPPSIIAKGTTMASAPVVPPVEKKPQAAPLPAPVLPSIPKPLSATPHSTPVPQPQIAETTKRAQLPAVESPKPVSAPELTERTAASSKESPRQLYKDARALLQKNDFSAAAAKLTQAVALDARDPLIWNALGYSRMRQKQYKEALAALDKAIALNPRYRNAYVNRSALKRSMGDGSGSAHDRREAKLLAKRR